MTATRLRPGLSSLLFLTQIIATAFLPPALAQSSTACNNSPKLCDEQYNQITHLGAHDSPFVANSSNGFTASGNQYYDSVTQLSAGVRLLSAQIHYVSQTSSWHLCHSSCDLYDAGLLSTWLSSIKSWLDSNPNEVVTLLLVNSDNITPTQLAAQYASAGLTSYAYTPSFTSASTSWPTLSKLISSGTRLVTFVPGIGSPDASAPYLLDEWTYVFENDYNIVQSSSTSCSGNFSCAANRPSTVSSAQSGIADGMMPLMNHLLYQDLGLGIQTPIPDCADTVNSPNTTSQGQLGYDAQQCQTAWSRKPWVILVDYFNVGPALATVDSLNGVTDPVGRSSVSTSIPSTTNAGCHLEPLRAVWVLVAALAMGLSLA